MLFDNVWGFWKSDVVNLLNISSISFSKENITKKINWNLKKIMPRPGIEPGTLRTSVVRSPN
jgi:hypothetical protein